jgi:uncharacterized protein
MPLQRPTHDRPEHNRLKHDRQPQPHGPLVFDIRGLSPGVTRSEQRTVPAPAELGVQLVRIPEGSDTELDVRLEGVSEGVLVTASVLAPTAGQCARCLDEFSGVAKVAFQELFAYHPDSGPQRGVLDGDEPDSDEPDRYLLDGDRLDLEPAVRDALVLELPLAPLCAADCAGLCPECGVRLADAGPGHRHDADGSGVWAALRNFRATGSQEQASPDQDGSGQGGPDGPAQNGTARNGTG